MKGLKLSPTVLYLPSNSDGNDYIVGDLHGCLTELLAMLDYVGFDKNKDRLFSVGDLIDRGPQSIELLHEFRIRKNWYFVKGNHEQMMIDSFVYDNSNMYQIWIQNGGTWIFDENKDELEEASIWLAENIPTIIVVGENESRFNICHAEIVDMNELNAMSNKNIDEWTFDEKAIDNLIWGRNIYNDYEEDYFINDVPFRYHSNELSITYVGHTPHFIDKETMKLLQLEKHIYMDLGACFMKHNHFKDQAMMALMNHTSGHYFLMDNKGEFFEGKLND
jgi:serine/threonine protein phosphatase 1